MSFQFLSVQISCCLAAETGIFTIIIMAHTIVTATVGVLLALTVTTESANILFLNPIGSPSHKNVALPIITGLADRGHNVTVVSSYPTKHAKVRDIHPFKDFDYFSPHITVMDHRRLGKWSMMFMSYDPILKFCHHPQTCIGMSIGD